MRIHSPVHFGAFTIAFSSPSSFVIKYLEQIFAGYESDRTPDFSINIKIFTSHESKLPALPSQQKISTQLVGNEKYFVIGDGLIRGSLDLKKKECSISIDKEVLSSQIYKVFQTFLYRIYHVLCRELSLKSFFIHGCGVLKENRSYLFIGNHESGKTTIGRLSNGLIIHDDQIIINIDEKGLTMDSPPLSGWYRNYLDSPCPINNIFFIVQNTDISMRRLNTAMALKRLYDEIVLPATLTSVDNRNARIKKANLCFEMLKLSTLYELHFDKEGKFWDHLTNIK
jgi:hypothetical protein